jgi:hypothetical protein
MRGTQTTGGELGMRPLLLRGLVDAGLETDDRGEVRAHSLAGGRYGQTLSDAIGRSAALHFVRFAFRP